jgi:drug/metabolite transporter (DMT)-like permease
MLVTSALVLTGIVLAMGVPLPGLQAGWWLLLVMGAGLTTATLLLYLGLVRGPVTVAAPIAGTFPAFNILLALALGMRPTAAEWAAMAAVMAGVFVVARSWRARRGTTRPAVTIPARICAARWRSRWGRRSRSP